MADFVTLLNPATGDPWQCPARSVDHFKDKGWKVAPKAQQSDDAAPAGKKG